MLENLLASDEPIQALKYEALFHLALDISGIGPLEEQACRVLCGQLELLLPRYNPESWLTKFDCMRGNEIFGWALREDSANPQFISVGVGDDLLFRSFLADAPRPELRQAGFEKPFYGFRLFIEPMFCKTDPLLVYMEDPDIENVIALKLLKLDGQKA